MTRERSGAISEPKTRGRGQVVLEPPFPSASSLEDGQANARLGVIYLFGHLNPSPNVFSVFLEGVTNLGGEALGFMGKTTGQAGFSIAKEAASATKPMIAKNLGGSLEKVTMGFWDWAEDFLAKLVKELQAKFGSAKYILGQVKGLIPLFVQIFAKEATPFVKSGLDIVKGGFKSAEAAVVRFRTWWYGRQVELVPGHPTAMVEALKRALNTSLFEGLYLICKGAGNAALTVATVGASVITKVIVAFMEAAVKIVWRFYELIKMSEFCQWCADEWQQAEKPGCAANHADVFGEVYRKYAMAVPTIAALTLNSGICGDKKRYLQLFEDGGLISQSNFDAGVKMIDGLKPFAGGMLRNAGFQLNPIATKNNFVKTLVDRAKAEPTALTTSGKVCNWIHKFLTT